MLQQLFDSDTPGLGSVLGNFWRRLTTSHARRRQLRLSWQELRQLDRHALRDLGLDRSKWGSYLAEANGTATGTRRRVASQPIQSTPSKSHGQTSSARPHGVTTGAISAAAVLSAGFLTWNPTPVDTSPGLLVVDAWRLKNGAHCILRPVAPQDAEPLGAMVQRLSHATRRNRFHAAVNALSAETLCRMTHLDDRRQVAFVVTSREAQGELVVADARYVVDADGAAAEFALVVDDLWQRMGVGDRAVAALCTAARQAGLNWLYGSVLSTNSAMLSLMHRHRFCCTPDQEDEQLVRVERRLRG